MEVVLPAIALAALVAFLVLQPLRTRSSASEPDRRGDLEAAKESKYREIKDAELDYRMGKLSEPDWRALDAELRAQAIEILRQLDRLEGR
ncbi:MAG: hypothetical protein ACRDJY_06415 [Thermoleophilaceae bacterium]